jgi:hypothetical protein
LLLPPTIRFDHLKSRYSVDVADHPAQPSLVTNIGRNNLAPDANLMLVVKLEQSDESRFEISLGNGRLDRHQLAHEQTVPLVIALKAGGRTPTTSISRVRFRLQGSTGGRTFETPCTVEARLVTRELKSPEIGMSYEPEVTFGVPQGSTSAATEVIIASLTPSVSPTVAAYDGPPADLVFATLASLIVARGLPAEPFPVRVGLRPFGRGSDEISWSQANPVQTPDNRSAMESRCTIPFPFDQGPIQIVLGVEVRDAIRIAHRLSGEDSLTAEVDLDVSLALVTDHRTEKLLQETRRVPAYFSITSLITVSSRDLAPIVLALTDASSPPLVQTGDSISRRVNLRGESLNRISSLESTYEIKVEAFAHARDPRLDVDFVLVYEHRNFVFPNSAITGHELRQGLPISVPLRQILEDSILKVPQRSHVPRRGELVLSFRFFEFENSPHPLFARLSIPIEIEMIPPDLVVCIDLGTSATSVWFGMVAGPNAGAVLPLGDVVHAISGDEHEEFDPKLGVENVLLPSLVGLSSDGNLRARLDPLSLGDIALTVGGMQGAERRLKSFGRRYDVSVPFVPRQDIPVHRETIVFQPKRSLIAARESPSLVKAFEFSGGALKPAGSIDIPSLIADVFDELGAYLVPRAITHFDRKTEWSGRRSGTLTDIWLNAKQPIGVIVTHPSGVSAQSRDAYIEAGRRFFARFTGKSIDRTKGADHSNMWVKLVPEAIAAINYGIGYLRDHGQLSPGKHVLAALDIGAGTYDATLVEADIGIGGLENWTVLSHFGLTIGGNDLDRAIADKVASVLRDAFGDVQVANQLTLDLDPPTNIGAFTATRRFAREIAFQDEIQRAKKQLTERLFLLPERAGFLWENASDIFFEVVVGREPDKENLPVRRKQPSRIATAQRIAVDKVGPTWLVIRPNKQDGAIEIVLQIGPGHFATNDAQLDDALSPATVARFLGTILPRMVMREVTRLKKKPPTWIVTGRTALWPPLYSAIQAVAELIPGSRMASPRPFPPSEMKVAVINGALAIASNPHLPLGNDVLNPLAVVSIAAEAQTADPSRTTRGRRVTRIAGIHYLTDSEQWRGGDEVTCVGRCELVRAVPGLTDPDAQDRPDKEALDMFDVFSIPPYERLVSDIAQTEASGTRHKLKITWNAGNRTTSVTIDPGDGSGLQRFDVPNRESRIYHD